MAITIDPANKIIQLDSFAVSVNQIWTAFVDWSVLSDNLKYGVGLTQLGGDPPVALYIFLELGWRVRPLESNGTTTITGNLLVREGGSPIAPTLGNFQILVNLETPVQAVAIAVSTGSVLTVDQDNKLNQIATRFDLDSAKPNTYADDGSKITNADFTLNRIDNGDGTFTVDKV